jgi:hypothetical protein
VKIRAFASFDLDHDNDLKLRMCDQAEAANSRVEVCDSSFREVAADWHDKLRRRMSNIDLLVVLCGAYTDRAANVHSELTLALEMQVSYLLLDGRPGMAKRPAAARATNSLVAWDRHTVATLGTTAASASFGESVDDNWLPGRLASRRGRKT